MTFMDTHVHRNCCNLIARISLPVDRLPYIRNDVSALHGFGDTVGDCLRPWGFVQFQQHSRYYYKPCASSDSSFARKHVLVNKRYISRVICRFTRKISNNKTDLQITQGHCCLCHSVGHIPFLMVFHCKMCLFCTVFRIFSPISQKLKSWRHCDLVSIGNAHLVAKSMSPNFQINGSINTKIKVK